MRSEYELMHALVFDASFRRAFREDARAAVDARYPGLPAHAYATNMLAGIEDEAHRRMAEICSITRATFPRGYHMLVALLGAEFFEGVLTTYFDQLPGLARSTDLFVPEIAGPNVMRAASRLDARHHHVRVVLEYEWAILCAREPRFASLRPPTNEVLAPSVRFIEAEFDLLGLLAQLDRIVEVAPVPWLIRERVRPHPGEFSRLIFRAGVRVVEAAVPPSARDELRALQNGTRQQLSQALRAELTRIGAMEQTS